ncbi:MAG: CGGC domain-containing protein [Deltaproteobacteria bacterium]|nr:CGGC domain-containing protein [Deltaproteobacteria bacterium]
MKKKIAIFYCKRIKDHTCIACAKCYKGAAMKAGEFARHDEDIEIVGMTDCGDCPGLFMPRSKMVMDMLDGMDRKPDAIHLGTCVKLACEHGECPLKPDELKLKVEAKFNIPLIIGTHDYT